MIPGCAFMEVPGFWFQGQWGQTTSVPVRGSAHIQSSVASVFLAPTEKTCSEGHEHGWEATPGTGHLSRRDLNISGGIGGGGTHCPIGHDEHTVMHFNRNQIMALLESLCIYKYLLKWWAMCHEMNSSQGCRAIGRTMQSKLCMGAGRQDWTSWFQDFPNLRFSPPMVWALQVLKILSRVPVYECTQIHTHTHMQTHTIFCSEESPMWRKWELSRSSSSPVTVDPLRKI